MQKPLTTKEAADKCRLSERRMIRLAADGRIPGAFQPAGPHGAWRFDAVEFRTWLTGTRAKGDKWHPSTDAAKSGGRNFKETGRFTAARSKQQRRQSLRSAY